MMMLKFGHKYTDPFVYTFIREESERKNMQTPSRTSMFCVYTLQLYFLDLLCYLQYS